MGLGLFFGKITSPNDNKITKIAFVQIYSRSTSHMNPEMTGLLIRWQNDNLFGVVNIEITVTIEKRNYIYYKVRNDYTLISYVILNEYFVLDFGFKFLLGGKISSTSLHLICLWCALLSVLGRRWVSLWIQHLIIVYRIYVDYFYIIWCLTIKSFYKLWMVKYFFYYP